MIEDRTDVLVQLYPLAITDRPDDMTGKVVSIQHANINDIIARVVKNRSDISPEVLRASYELLSKAAEEELVEKGGVEFGLCHTSLGVKGVFHGENASWDASANKLVAHNIPTARTRKALGQARVKVKGMAVTGPVINTITDSRSKEVNKTITPGGGVSLRGTHIKIAGSNTEAGIFFDNVTTKASFPVPYDDFVDNDPSHVSFIAPALPNGDYRVRVVTYYGQGGHLVKTPVSYQLDYILAVGDGNAPLERKDI